MSKTEDSTTARPVRTLEEIRANRPAAPRTPDPSKRPA